MINDLMTLIKIRITLLVIITSYLGYYLGLRYTGYMMIESHTIITFFHLAVGIFFTSSSAAIFNQYYV